jgi:hypothetical protein
MIAAARGAALRVTRWLPVVPRAGKDPLFSAYALRHDRGPVASIDEPPLVVRERDGRRTPEFVALRADMGLPP